MNLWHEWQRRGLGKVLIDRARAWAKSFKAPDPWSDDLDAAVRAPDAVPVCHRCMTPCELAVFFCPTCGSAFGPYNNILPFIRIFSLGEVLRSGLSPTARFTRLTVPGYIAVGMNGLWFLSAFYYVRLIMNYVRIGRHGAARAEDPAD